MFDAPLVYLPKASGCVPVTIQGQPYWLSPVNHALHFTIYDTHAHIIGERAHVQLADVRLHAHVLHRRMANTECSGVLPLHANGTLGVLYDCVRNDPHVLVLGREASCERTVETDVALPLSFVFLLVFLHMYGRRVCRRSRVYNAMCVALMYATHHLGQYFPPFSLIAYAVGWLSVCAALMEFVRTSLTAGGGLLHLYACAFTVSLASHVASHMQLSTAWLLLSMLFISAHCVLLMRAHYIELQSCRSEAARLRVRMSICMVWGVLFNRAHELMHTLWQRTFMQAFQLHTGAWACALVLAFLVPLLVARVSLLQN